MSHVFISYSRNDEKAVNRIKSVLMGLGIDVWIDKEDIDTGARWDVQIEEAIQGSEIILVVLSKASVESNNVGDEWSYAIEKNKHIVPVVLEECDVPMRIASLQRIEFLKDFDEGMKNLVDAINRKEGQVNSGNEEIKKKQYKQPFRIPSYFKVAVGVCIATVAAVFGYAEFYSPVVMNNLVGKSLPEAEEYFESKRLDYVIHREPHSGEENTVYKTEPEGGIEFDRQKKVHIYVVEEKVSIPEVVGSNKQDAVSKLEALGLKVKLDRVAGFGTPDSGKIISMVPSAGDSVARDTIITLSVADKVRIPDVIGLSREEAVDELENKLGLKVVVKRSVRYESDKIGEIVGMSLVPGEVVEQGSAININLADRGGWVYLKSGKVEALKPITKGFNLRSEPVSGDNIVDTLSKGEFVKIVKKQGDWRFVRVVDPSDV